MRMIKDNKGKVREIKEKMATKKVEVAVEDSRVKKNKNMRMVIARMIRRKLVKSQKEIKTDSHLKETI